VNDTFVSFAQVFLSRQQLEICLPTGTTIVREYTSHEEYTVDADRLARLGYVVIEIVEQLPPPGLAQWARRVLFASAQVRLRVSYSDQGAAV
jgi:hypothetical protein